MPDVVTDVNAPLELRLGARAPFAGAEILGFLRTRAIPGVEEVSERHYRRAVWRDGQSGRLHVELDDARPGVVVRLDCALAPFAEDIVARVRDLFDLDARPDLVDAHLGRDPRLAALVARTPGLRVPGAFDGFELAVRAVLGQQVSVRAATTLSGRLVAAFGESAAPDGGAQGWLFPSAARLARAGADEVRAIGLPQARAATIVGLATAVATGAVDLSPTADAAVALAALVRVRGIGAWTAGYVAIRVFRAPDVFLADDLAARKALGIASQRDAARAAAGFSPYRSYALMHLWRSLL